jgi:hypothetical protein
MTTTKRKVSPWPRGVKTKVYDAMIRARFESGGLGYEMGDWVKERLSALYEGGQIETAEEVRSRSFGDYTDDARSRLHGMAAIVALVEGRTQSEVVDEVWDS